MFLQASVVLSTGGGVCLSACWDATHPHQEQTPPPEQTPPGPDTPPGADHPPEQTSPQSRHIPPPEQTPPREADSGIRSTSGRYASYWNAFLFILQALTGVYNLLANNLGTFSNFPAVLYYTSLLISK